jgi:hypothetical protein
MHELAHKCAQEAKDDIENGVLHPNKWYCLMCDYAQNLGIPHFGKEQPRDMCHYSPLTINVFGLVDLSRSPNPLDCYAYQEYMGKKGSNNVASLFMHNIHRHGMLQDYSPAERLTIIVDNCSGQNKNNHVLQFVAYLAEIKFFRNVEFVFYVRGHTKNTCDQLFNEMKICFHKDQVHSYRVALGVLNSQPNVTMTDATEDMFNDYGKMIDTFYCNFEAGTIRINHIFKMDMKEETSFEIQCSTHDGLFVVWQTMLKWGAQLGLERLDLIKAYRLETLKPAGLRAIKQVELYKKWWQYVDPQYWEEMCPKPYDDVMLQVKKDKSEKRKEWMQAHQQSWKKKKRKNLKKPFRKKQTEKDDAAKKKKQKVAQNWLAREAKKSAKMCKRPDSSAENSNGIILIL